MIKNILKEAKWIVAGEDWLEKEVRNPETGNIVKVKSLPAKERAKYKPKDEAKQHKKNLSHAHKDLKSLVGGRNISKFEDSGNTILSVKDHPDHTVQNVSSHLEGMGWNRKSEDYGRHHVLERDGSRATISNVAYPGKGVTVQVGK